MDEMLDEDSGDWPAQGRTEALLGGAGRAHDARPRGALTSRGERSLDVRNGLLIALCSSAATLLACAVAWRAGAGQVLPVLGSRHADLGVGDEALAVDETNWELRAPIAPISPVSSEPSAPTSWAPLSPMPPFKALKPMKPMKAMEPMSWAPMPSFTPLHDAKSASSKPSYSSRRSLPTDREYGPPTERPEYSRPLTPEPSSSAPHVIANASDVCAWSSYRLPTGVVPVAYNLTLELSSLHPPALVYGKVAIELRRNVSRPSPRCLILHASPEMSIDGLAICANETSCTALHVAYYDAEWAQLQVELRAELPHAAHLHVRFSYPLRDKLTGLYHSSFVGVDGREHSIATTQHEATSARETFPCWDEPGFKATFQLALNVKDDEQLVALSNMPALGWYALQVDAETDESLRQGRPLVAEADVLAANASGVSLDQVLEPVGLRRVEFDTSPRMSTYLLALSVGEFEAIETRSKSGVTLRAWAPAATHEVSKLRFALSVAAKALDVYEELLQVPFPLPKIDIVSIPDFGPGAMENWGLITYRATNVLADELSAPHDRQAVACTVVHELGHQARARRDAARPRCAPCMRARASNLRPRHALPPSAIARPTSAHATPFPPSAIAPPAVDGQPCDDALVGRAVA